MPKNEITDERFEEIKKHLYATHTMAFKACDFCDCIAYAEQLKSKHKFNTSIKLLSDNLSIAVDALEEFADESNPNELKYMSYPSSEYMKKARLALKKIRGLE